MASDSTTDRSPVSRMPRVAARRIEPPSRSIAQATQGRVISASDAKLPVADHHISEIDDQLHRFQEDGGDTLGDRIAHQGRVIQEVGDELAGMHGVEIGEVAADQPCRTCRAGRRRPFSRPANPATSGRNTK